MPVTNRTPTEEKRARVRACMERYMRLCGVDANYLAKRMSVTVQTINNWIRKPDAMQLEDVWALSTILKCSVSELAGGELPEEMVGKLIAKAMKAM